MDKSSNHKKMSVKSDHIFYNSTYRRILIIQINKEIKQISGCVGLGNSRRMGREYLQHEPSI
jgi:hypothetical protein